MRSAKERLLLGTLTCGLVLLAGGGCGLVGDLFAPQFAQEFGLDPATIKPQQGTVLVAFDNTTRFPATFFAYESVDAQDLTRSSRNFSADVAAGKVANEVLDCPVGLISPGSLGSNFAVDRTAVILAGTVGTTATGTTLLYAGNPVISGSSFSCGDVIEIRLSATGAADQPVFTVSVRVIPGR